MHSPLPASGPPQRIAVIGAGIAGLAAAWRLARAGHAVALYERQARPGFIAHSVAVAGAVAGTTVRVDVPIRVFYAGYYPALMRLYQALGVDTEPVSYASSFHGGDGQLFFRYRNLRFGDFSYSYLLPQDLAGARARAIAAGALRFHREAPRALAAGELAGRSIGEFIAAGRYAPEFVQGLLLPAICTVCTCPYADALAFPAEVIVGYLLRGLTREAVRRARQGADDAAARLVAGVGEVHCGVRIAGLRQQGDRVALRLADGSVRHFDHAVFATQANHALALLEAPTPAEAATLAGFTYRPVEVVMHRDAALLPPLRRHWSAVNLLVAPQASQPQSTIWVNAVQSALRDAAPVFQTVHPLQRPRDEHVIAASQFERPVVDARSERALVQLAALQAEPPRRLWFCGSYAQPGIPLLESAVRSAEVVAEALARRTAEGRGGAAPALAAT